MKKNIQNLIASSPETIINHIKNLERMRQDFVANVSHELRTPLTVIHGYLETLIEQAHDDTKPWKNIFIQMQSQTIRMEHLVEDLLLLSRLENDDEKKID
jgi:two-component system phosphate regulon sensor histidine kinase PhoR